MSGRGRSLRTGISYDDRTGFRVKGHKLRSDGERPGIQTVDPDQQHPGRFLRVPPPDGVTYRPGLPAKHSISQRVDMSRVIHSDPNQGATSKGSTKLSALRSSPSPSSFCGTGVSGSDFIKVS